MQEEPIKTYANYNEFRGADPTAAPLGDTVELIETTDKHEVIESGLRLVTDKINEILGEGNHLTSGDVALPNIEFIEDDPDHPTWAGYFSPFRNKIAIITGRIKNQIGRKKVFIHEYIHFLSHNGRDDSERIDENSPITRHNNVGFHRNIGLDIRKGKENEPTSDYFLAFNEAVTEQLAIDILPGVDETYDGYRELLNQVIDDAVTMGLGTTSNDEIFKPWSRQEIKDYIYRCFFRGDLAGFTRLLQTTYQKYDISEQQFGLMTSKDDLPSIIETTWTTNHPDDPPPTPGQTAAMVQARLDVKTSHDYITDILGPNPGGGDHHNQNTYGEEYDNYVKEHNIVHSHTETVDGKEYELDSMGYVIYPEEVASLMLKEIKVELDDLLARVGSGGIDKRHITERMDHLLFDTYYMSMLSVGFREFYIYKHSKIDNL